ncbi:hypothetical protein VCR20J5_210364 [Vibrio crassostreae]|nr:hypothetical protein VCR15J5_480127 [Vibrio crassostreae]CDT33463.1 hypothetical protein VCR20J5_210364 [Vibrio crassostreae]
MGTEPTLVEILRLGMIARSVDTGFATCLANFGHWLKLGAKRSSKGLR